MATAANAQSWRAGTASVRITPSEPMWLAGWAARRQPAQRAAMDLFAKAIAFDDGRGQRCVFVTADLIAIPHEVATAVASRLRQSRQLAREQILFNASHTHTAPEVRPDKVPFFEIPPEFAAKIPPYVQRLESQLVEISERALDQLQPVTVQFAQANVAFATNRRAGGGATDHAVPILIVRRNDGAPHAIVFGYACHTLVLPPTFCEYHGDYAGVAQQRLEEQFPDATALFVSGAGADQDPSPRGTLELVAAHGRQLADAVGGAVRGRGESVTSNLGVGFEEVILDLLPLPSRATLEADLRSDDPPRARKARFLLDALAAGALLPTTLRCPVQVVRFGRDLLLVALGGEPVVEYALRVKREFRDSEVWVAGYSNDMFGYLPTRDVQQQGGYEGGRANLWSALPTPLGPAAEERVVEAVHRLVQQVRDR